jgi:general secretion pathway protein E
VADDGPAARLGLDVARCRTPVGCVECGGSGYRGRMILAEMIEADDSEIGRAILSRSDVPRIEALAVASGMVSLRERACRAVEDGATSPAEIRRVLGVSERSLGQKSEPAVDIL